MGNFLQFETNEGETVRPPPHSANSFVLAAGSIVLGPATRMCYWMALSAWQAASVAATTAPVGSLRITPDSSEQNVRVPD